ncbi:hypothetical protein FHE66_00800 [Georgenia sp. 311]|uniref:hypothetical protein n=1 Tax=Georgenia sp. 311 TaxID=2585134 RepID=UPI0011120A81|nr:hypothetical protein [Georgenia sp. 311]TNC20786.1 hypothetical protein FHE66_00800 [Georgenia sp. 311]
MSGIVASVPQLTTERSTITVTPGLALGLAALAAAAVTVLSAFSGLVNGLVAAGVAVALVAVADLAIRPRRGVPPLYHYAPEAPEEARAHGTPTTAVVEHRQTRKVRGGATLVTWRLLVAGHNGRPYRTTTMATCPHDAVPTHGVGTVVAVRVHREHEGVVVVVEDTPTEPPPTRPSRPVRELPGTPRPEHGIVTTEFRGALLLLVPLLLGALTPLCVLALA